jgi:uncharacterized protein (DUF427 family)
MTEDMKRPHVIRAGATVIGQTDHAVALVEGGGRPVIYVPRGDMKMNLLQATSHQTTCPWKGQASYLTLFVDGDANPDAVWTYPEPKEAAKEIAGRFAFWKLSMRPKRSFAIVH